MNHLVRFTTAEGREGHLFATSVEDAVGHIERLRNVESATDITLLRLTPVPLEFKTYFKAQVADEPSVSQPASPAVVAPMPTRVVAADRSPEVPISPIPMRAVSTGSAGAVATAPARADVAKGLFSRS